MVARRITLPGVVLLAWASAARATDHGNLDAGRPTRLEDAYTIAAGEIALELGGGFSVRPHGADRAIGAGSLLLGAAPNLQVGLGGFLSTHPDSIDEDTKSGDLQISALYNFNQETLTLPAFAVEGELNLPTGDDSSGVDATIRGIVTRSIDRVSFHFNAGYEFLSGTPADERDGRYELALGASLPIGAPLSTRTVLIADIFTVEGARKGDDALWGVEAGVRYQFTPRVVLDGGLGTEFAGSDRSTLLGTVGISISF
jgi:hypothetical protein